MSKPPEMSLDLAWSILGRNVAEIMAAIRSLPTRKAKIVALTRALSMARKDAKRIMAANHPDVNNSKGSLTLFRSAQDALNCIEYHTEATRLKSEELDQKVSQGPGFVVIK